MQFNEIQTRNDLADFLGIQRKTLTYVLYEKHVDSFYNSFDIPKKSGGVRHISAPTGALKSIQRILAQKLCEYQVSIRGKKGNNISHAFEKNKSILTNSKIHKNKRYILSLDLENFFDAFHFGRIVGFFQLNRCFLLPREVAIVLAQLTCYNGHLPQGAPSSPVITNMICQIMDYHVLALAKKYKVDYTRYADDLTFSTNSRDFLSHKDSFITEIQAEINRSGFSLNSAKTRLEFRDSRQVVTGIVVNKKLNVPRSYYKNTRAMISSLYSTGEFEIDGELGTLQQLEGRLSFIDQIEYYNNINDFSGAKHKWNSLSTKERMYRNFLFYRNFVANQQLVLLTEGKTDILYIKAALKSLYQRYPKLINKENNGQYRYKIRFFKRSHHWDYFFDMPNDGADGMKKLYWYFSGQQRDNLVEYFVNKKTKFSSSPVIFLYDNEKNTKRPLRSFVSGAKLTEEQEKELSERFYTMIEKNCRLVLATVPLPEGKSECELEDLFDDETLNIEISGRKFSRKDEDTQKFYNKDIFSKYVYSHYKEISFEGFIPLLDYLNSLNDTVIETKE